MPSLLEIQPSRRRFLKQVSALGTLTPALLARAADPIINPPTLLENESGGYRVLPGGQVFSSGAIANDGYEIVHALLKPWLPLEAGYRFVERYLAGIGRPVQAICGMELRSAKQMSFDEFRSFNVPYVEQLTRWELVLGRYSAVARTNVTPAAQPPAQASLYAFSYCVPSDHKGITFCTAGTADIDARGNIVAKGDTSAAGLKAKLDYVYNVIGGRLAELGMGWNDTTHVDLYAALDLLDLWDGTVLPMMKEAVQRGVRLYHARPPILDSEVELEARGVQREVVLATS